MEFWCPLRMTLIEPYAIRTAFDQGDYPNARINKRFDHIRHTPERAWIGLDAGSDHASVMARILLPENGNDRLH